MVESTRDARNHYNRLMTDSADHLAVAIRQIVEESVDAALRAQPQRMPSPPEPPRSLDQPTGDRLLYSVQDVQNKLRIGRSTLYNLLKVGRLPSVKIGRRRFVAAAALNDYVRGLS